MDDLEESRVAAAEVTPQKGLWLYVAVPVAGLLLCGSEEPWALGILALLVALAAWFATPLKRVTPWVSVPVLVALGLCLTAFLPASWSSLPEWRQALQRDFGVIMAPTRSPQPWISLEGWLVMAVGACWLVFCLARGFSSSERRTVIRFLTGFIAALATISILLRWWRIPVPFWQAEWDTPYFGPFPNRNHFSGLLAVGAVLAFAATYDAFRRKQRLWMPLALSVLPMFAAVLLNMSRLGVIVFFGGVGAWMFTATFQKRSAHRVAVSAAVLLVMAAAFLLFGQSTTEMFFDKKAEQESVRHVPRLTVLADTVVMTGRTPVLGTGLGNFEPVFAMSRTEGELHSRALHPDNDWLWFGAEAGLPCLLLALVVFGAIVPRSGPWRTHDTSGRRDRRLRNAAGISVLLLCVEGMVDTPLHAPGFFVLGTLLAGLALNPAGEEDTPPRPGTVLLRRIGGAACALAGLGWLFTAAGVPVIRGESVYRQLSAQASALEARGEDARALEVWDEAASLKPLQWNLYFKRAALKLRLGHTSREAFGDFSRSRRLEPHSVLLCRREFDVWLQHDPAYGIPALREALRRDAGLGLEFFQQRVNRVTLHPLLRPHFLAIAKTDAKLGLAYLPHASPAEFPGLLDTVLVTSAGLEAFTPEERLHLFQTWHAKGDAAELIRLLEEKPLWRQDGWSVLAAHRAREGNFRAAYEVAMNNVPAPLKTGPRRDGDLAALTREFAVSPNDISRGFDLYEVQRQRARHDDALATLDRIAKFPAAPSKVFYERAVILAEKGDYARAWDAIREYSQRIEEERKAL